MKDFEKIFREFLILNENRIEIKKNPFKDVYIGENHLLRCYEYKYTIHYLKSSDSIQIPSPYIDIFTNFNTEYSGQISELLNDNNPHEKRFNKTLRYLLKLSRDLQSNILFYKTDSIIDSIEKIVDLGMLIEVRNTVKELTGLKLDPWKIENLNQCVSI